MTWPAAFRVIAGLLVLVAVVLAALYLVADNAFKPGTPLSRWQARIEAARVTSVLDRPRELDGALFPAGTEIRWEDPSHRRVAAARLPATAEILGVRATNLRRVAEGGWIVALAEASAIDGWFCATGEVELTATGRLWNCELAGTPSWRGWHLPEGTSVAPRPDIHQVWLTFPPMGALDKPLESPVLGKLDWIVAFNEDGSPFGCTFSPAAPYAVAEQELSGDVRWEYDPATDGMGRDRPPVAVSGFAQDPGGTGLRRHVILPWPGPTPGRKP